MNDGMRVLVNPNDCEEIRKLSLEPWGVGANPIYEDLYSQIVGAIAAVQNIDGSEIAFGSWPNINWHLLRKCLGGTGRKHYVSGQTLHQYTGVIRYGGRSTPEKSVRKRNGSCPII
jgi:hypothetical protein